MLDCFVSRAGKGVRTLIPITKDGLKDWVAGQKDTLGDWVEKTGFSGEPGTILVLPPGKSDALRVLVGVGQGDLWGYASVPKALGVGTYRYEGKAEEDAILGWALGSYRFDRYRNKKKDKHPVLHLSGKSQARDQAERLAEAQYLVRDLVNTPANDMGPAELAAAARKMAKRFRAKCVIHVGKQLLDKNYPTVHAVGRASVREPRLIDIRWGNAKHKKLTLVGKGVCFDTGGLNLKPTDGMLLMKKDMGGAAHVLGLAQAIMSAGLKVRLRVLVPAVENSVDGNAYRPLDVLTTRSGITVEIGNTDAEGRLVMSDALTEAVREKPDLLIDFATLTGAARVALGTELPAMFTNDDDVAASYAEAGETMQDPVWRMPLHEPYRRLLNSKVADLNNISRGRFGGAITAALFLREFVGKSQRWVHFDVMAWNLENQAGRPAGGEAMGLRASFDVIRRRFK